MNKINLKENLIVMNYNKINITLINKNMFGE